MVTLQDIRNGFTTRRKQSQIADTVSKLGELTGWKDVPELLLSLFHGETMDNIFVSLARKFPEDVLFSLVSHLEALEEHRCAARLLYYSNCENSTEALLDLYLRSAGKSGPLVDHHIRCGFYDVLEERFKTNLQKFVWHGHSDPLLAQERQDYYLHEECDLECQFLHPNER